MKYVILTFWILVILIALTFTALNSHPVIIDYYLGTKPFQLPVLLLLVLVIGILLGVIVMLPALLRSKNRARQFKNQAKNNTQELNNLRRMPLKEDR